MKYRQLLDRFQVLSGLDVSSFYEEGGFTFVLPNKKGEIYCEVGQNEHELAIYMDIGEVPSYKEESYLKMVLEAHCLGVATGQALFGYDAESHKIYLFRVLNIKFLSGPDCRKAIEELLISKEFWSERLKDTPLT